MRDFKTFIVITHHAPYDGPAAKSSWSNPLARYLARSAVPLIDMRSEQALDQYDFYSDHIHATKKGQAAATKALAEDIYKIGLIR